MGRVLAKITLQSLHMKAALGCQEQQPTHDTPTSGQFVYTADIASLIIHVPHFSIADDTQQKLRSKGSGTEIFIVSLQSAAASFVLLINS